MELRFLIVFHSACEDEAFIPTAPLCFVSLTRTTDFLKEDGKANKASLEHPVFKIKDPVETWITLLELQQ